MTRRLITSTIAAVLLLACTAEDGGYLRGRNGDPNDDPNADPNAAAPGDPTQPGSCQEGVAHPGFDAQNFVADRVQGGIGADRLRVKPYSALRTEFMRTLGQVPASMATSQAAFGEAPARWYGEPTAGAVSLYTTYSVAFTGCFDTMADAKYAQAPTAATAAVECAALQRKAWQRTATPDETAACVDLAVSGLATETVARRRWAHACASVLTSTGLTSY